MKKSIDKIPEETKLNFALAVELVSKYSKVPKRILLKNTSNKYANQRFMVFTMLKYTKAADVDSASLFDKDHSTVINGLKEHVNLYEQNYKNYAVVFDKAFKEFKIRISPEGLKKLDPQNQNFYDVIREISRVEKSIQKIKNVLLDSYIEGFEINEEILKKLKTSLFK